MVSPAASLPASTAELVTVTSSRAPFRQFELRLELPIRRPFFGFDVIVNVVLPEPTTDVGLNEAPVRADNPLTLNFTVARVGSQRPHCYGVRRL